MTKRNRKHVQFHQKPAAVSAPTPEPPWQPMANAAFPPEVEAQMKVADPNYVGVFRNNLYQVMLREYPYNSNPDVKDDKRMVSWLVIRRLDSEPTRDWRHFQKIKNDICGSECEGIELYPAESRLVDTSNQYHIFVMPLGAVLPFGYQERDVSDSSKLEPWNKNKQRDFGAETPEQLNARVSTDKTIAIYGAPTDAPTEKP